MEDLSCTDIKQQWGKIKQSTQEMYKPVPIKQFCRPIVKREAVETNPAKKRKITDVLQILLEGK